MLLEGESVADVTVCVAFIYSRQPKAIQEKTRQDKQNRTNKTSRINKTNRTNKINKTNKEN